MGLTTAACLASLGHDVVGADLDADKVSHLSKGEVPILEEGLPALVGEGIAAQRLRFVVGAAAAVRDVEFVFLSVPTPQGASGEADLSAIQAVAREIGPVLPPERDRRHQVDGAGGNHPQAGAVAPRGGRPPRRRGGVEPRVPPRRHRGARLPQSVAHRHRLRRHRGRGAGLRAVPRHRRAARRHRRGLRRADQVRVERVPRDEDLLHQLDQRHLRGGQRRREGRRARDGLRPADRASSSSTRARGTADRASPRTPRRCSTPRGASGTTSASCAA